MDTVARYDAWIDKNFWQPGNVRHGSAASLPEGIFFLRAMLIWPVVGYIESSAGRDMAPYATSSWTNATRSRFRQRKGKVSKLIFITFDQTMIFRERERGRKRKRETSYSNANYSPAINSRAFRLVFKIISRIFWKIRKKLLYFYVKYRRSIVTMDYLGSG